MIIGIRRVPPEGNPANCDVYLSPIRDVRLNADSRRSTACNERREWVQPVWKRVDLVE